MVPEEKLFQKKGEKRERSKKKTGYELGRATYKKILKGVKRVFPVGGVRGFNPAGGETGDERIAKTAGCEPLLGKAAREGHPNRGK